MSLHKTGLTASSNTGLDGLIHHGVLKYWDRSVAANSVDPDQTAPRRAV